MYRYALVIFVIFCSKISLLYPEAVHGEQNIPSISVNSNVDKNKITIGDLIRYSVKITRNKNLTVEMPGLAANLGQFEIRDYAVHQTRKFDDFLVDSVDYSITTFDTGTYIIPPLSVPFLMADSSRDTIKTDPISIRVESVNISGAKDIKDIKPPLSIPRNWRMYYLYGGIVFLVLLLAGMGYWGYKRRKAGLPLLPLKEEPIRPAHEIALEALEQLAESSLLIKNRVKEYYIIISEIIRTYIENRYFINSLEMTTAQLIEHIQSTDMPDSVREELDRFLQECDLVKFAKYIPDTGEIEASTRSAYTIVNQTKWTFIERPVIQDQKEMETVPADDSQEKQNE